MRLRNRSSPPLFGRSLTHWSVSRWPSTLIACSSTAGLPPDRRRIDIEKIVRDVYRAAGYGGSWNPDPGKIRVTTDLCQEVLSPEESDIRPFSDDQNIVIGYACGDERTNYLPAAHWVSGELGRRLFARLRSTRISPRSSDRISRSLLRLKVTAGLQPKVEWRRLVLSIQHIPRLPYERQHRILLPLLEQILKGFGGRRAKGSSFDLHSGQDSSSTGQGNLPSVARRGTMGFQARSSLSTITDLACRSAAEHCAERIRIRWTSAGHCGPGSCRRSSSKEELMRPASFWGGRREVMRRSSSRHQPPREA